MRGGGAKLWLFAASSDKIMSGSSGMSSLAGEWASASSNSVSEKDVPMAMDRWEV